MREAAAVKIMKENNRILLCRKNSKAGDQRGNPKTKIIANGSEHTPVIVRQEFIIPGLSCPLGKNLIRPMEKPTLENEASKPIAEIRAPAKPTSEGR